MSDMSQGPGWWQASDGKWYPPEQAPGAQAPGAPPAFGTPPQYGAPQYGAPQYGAPVGAPLVGGAQLAEWPQRVIATLLDGVLLLPVYIVAIIFAQIADVLGLLIYLVAIAGAFYFAYLTGATGQSPGKRLTGIKVIVESTGQPLGGAGGIIRQFIHVVDSFCLIGYLFPLWDPKKQTFTDKIQSTVVVTGVPKQQLGPDLFKA